MLALQALHPIQMERGEAEMSLGRLNAIGLESEIEFLHRPVRMKLNLVLGVHTENVPDSPRNRIRPKQCHADDGGRHSPGLAPALLH